MQVDLAEKTAVVTGAGRGNGEAIGKRLGANGASVVVNDIDEAPAADTVSQIEAAGGEGIALTADVSDVVEVEAMFDRARDAYGGIDILVNNAGIADSVPIVDKPAPEKWSKAIDTHLRGAINCSTTAVEEMTERGSGSIVNITSIHTKNGVGMSPQYDVAKFGLLGLTKSLALELGRHGIRVNAVAPGWTNTRMTASFDDATRERIVGQNPLGRFAEPEEIADVVLFLASPASDYVNGHELRVDGGQVPIDSWKERFE